MDCVGSSLALNGSLRAEMRRRSATRFGGQVAKPFYSTSSTFEATMVRFAFENARPIRVRVLPLPANLSA